MFDINTGFIEKIFEVFYKFAKYKDQLIIIFLKLM
jgi:hypothetical protein